MLYSAAFYCLVSSPVVLSLLLYWKVLFFHGATCLMWYSSSLYVKPWFQWGDRCTRWVRNDQNDCQIGRSRVGTHWDHPRLMSGCLQHLHRFPLNWPWRPCNQWKWRIAAEGANSNPCCDCTVFFSVIVFWSFEQRGYVKKQIEILARGEGQSFSVKTLELRKLCFYLPYCSQLCWYHILYCCSR